jgi:hypothetical protein
MDEAARRLPDDGVILCFDADTTCREDYLVEVGNYFREQRNVNSASIYFEHPITGTEFSEEIYKAIVQYELHLRYFIDCQKGIHLPYAYQTVGSAMAVRNIIYQKVGGMNVRKAGEDFYFVHKCIKNGGFGTCNSTVVYPSPRISSRVPFGTGKAVQELINGSNSTFYTYHPNSFILIKNILSKIEGIYHGSYRIPEELIPYFNGINFEKKVEVIRNNTASFQSFKKQFFHLFDAFMLMKCLHYIRDNLYPNVPVVEACKIVYPFLPSEPEKVLFWFRNKDQGLI